MRMVRKVPKGHRPGKPLVLKGERLIEETRNIDGLPALVLWSKKGWYILREWDKFHGWGDRAYRTLAEATRHMHGPLKMERNMARAQKNAAAGAEKVVRAFLEGRKAREGSRAEYMKGVARYATDGTTLLQWGNKVAWKTATTLELSDAGWKSKTTMALLNDILRRTAPNTRIFQKSHEWFLSTPEGVRDWPGQVSVTREGSVLGNPKRYRYVGKGKVRSSSRPAKLVRDLRGGVFDVSERAPIRGMVPWQYERQEQMRSSENGRVWRVNIYRTWDEFGGPEEGGWWYTVGVPTGDYYPLRSFHSAMRLHDKLNAKFRKDREDLMARVEKGPGRKFPERRPHYENNGGKRRNPLTRKEAGQFLRAGSRALELAREKPLGSPARSYWRGRAVGAIRAVEYHGPKAAFKAAEKLGVRVDRARSIPNGLSCLKNLHTARERAYAKALITRYWLSGKAALIKGNIAKAAHAYGALAAIRRLARFELPHAQTVANLASFRLDLLRRAKADLARYRKGLV